MGTGTRAATRALGALGELLVLAAAVLALYAAWVLWGTAAETAGQQDRLRDQLQQQWESAPAPRQPGTGRAAAPRPSPSPTPGQAIAMLRIPRLGADWEWVVVEGIGRAELAKGVGHYPRSASAGKVGNYALAGHRAGYGEPFAELPSMRRGDLIEVTTAGEVLRYRVYDTLHTTPDDVDAVAPVPGRPGVKPTRRLVSLTTCTPRYGSTGRFIVYGELVERQQRPAGGR